jgi:hypothetical protein
MAGMYGYSSGLGKVPNNWAGHSSVPDFMVDHSLGDMDTRPTHMRGGFFPDHLAIPRALGAAEEPTIVLPTVEEVKEKGLLDKLRANPYLLMGIGISIGALLAYKIIGPKNFMRRKRRRRRRRRRR